MSTQERRRGLSRKSFSCLFHIQKEGVIVLTCVKDNIIEKKEQYKAIGLRGFVYKLCKEEEGERI